MNIKHSSLINCFNKVIFFVTSDKGGGKCVCPRLSVCLLARLFKTRARIWVKCCVSTYVGTWTNWLTFEPDTDYSPNARTRLLSPLSHKCWYIEFYVGKIWRIRKMYWPCAEMCGFTMVSLTEAVSHWNTFVGGTCTPPSALVVSIMNWTFTFCPEMGKMLRLSLGIKISISSKSGLDIAPLCCQLLKCFLPSIVQMPKNWLTQAGKNSRGSK